MLEGYASVKEASLNPKSRMLCWRGAAEWLLWLERYARAVRSAVVASKRGGFLLGEKLASVCLSFLLSNFVMQSLLSLTLRRAFQYAFMITVKTCWN